MKISINNCENGIMYDDIALFIHIVRHNSLNAAAQYLGIPTATVTRRLQKLEAKLELQLIHRSARQFNLTTEGEVYYHAYAETISELDRIHEHLESDKNNLSGRLKVLAPTNISIGFLQIMWSEFILQHPNIQLDLVLNNTIDDFFSQKADLALRIGPQKDSSLHQKRLGEIPTILVAAPRYLAKHPPLTSIDELHKHSLLGTRALTIWQLYNQEDSTHKTLHPKFSSTANDLSFITQLTSHGAGISLLPITEVLSLIKTGQLIQVLKPWQGQTRELFAIWASGKLLSTKAKYLRQYIEDYLAQSFQWDLRVESAVN